MRKRPEEPESLQIHQKMKRVSKLTEKTGVFTALRKPALRHSHTYSKKNKNTSSTAKFHALGITGERLPDNTCNIHV